MTGNRGRPADSARTPLDTRYLQTAGLDAASARGSVVTASAAGAVVHLLVLLLVAVAVMVAPDAGGGFLASTIGVIGTLLVVILAIVLAWTRGGDSAASKLRSARSGLRAAATSPSRTVRLFGGSVVVVVGYVLTFVGATLTVVPHTAALGVALVYLAAVPVAALLPVPGAVLVLDAVLFAGLLLDGIDPVPAVVAVLLFRAVTFWLVLPAGVLAHRRLSRGQAPNELPATA